MSPLPGTRVVRHAGDLLTFTLTAPNGQLGEGWQARLRTNLGRAERVREEILQSHFEKLPLAGAAWRDLPLQLTPEGQWSITLPLTEVGYFKAKAYAIDSKGFQHWTEGPDVGISIHPSWTRTANTVYCAFPRMFGEWSKHRLSTAEDHNTPILKALDQEGFTVIPPSGTLRSLITELPHIIDRLGCRILHLLPVSPTPTTFARFGRYGSPYALQHLTQIDPALVEFDRRTTGVDQFRELAVEIHSRGARLMLDLVINHTGWGSAEWEEHPEWFLRNHDGEFESPGAWNVVWEDLVEMDQSHVALWDYLADAFLIWCRRGVDGFRCDAGYKIPPHVWQFITAKVRREFPDTVFLLEGLGGPWEATEACLAEGGMQWAYSELFQNHGSLGISGYLDHHLQASARCGILVHYSETHDNSRLAANGGVPGQPATPEGRRWSLFRNRLAALTSIQGGFGFTAGVEWCATEQINVHSSRGLAWGSANSLVPELSALNRLISNHPCFFDGTSLRRISDPHSMVYALRRDSAEGLDRVLVLANTEFEEERSIELDWSVWEELGKPTLDLVGHLPAPRWQELAPAPGQLIRRIRITLAPGATHCMSPSITPLGLSGDVYRETRRRADWAAMCRGRVSRGILSCSANWKQEAAWVSRDPVGFLTAAAHDESCLIDTSDTYRPVIVWQAQDRKRVTLVPPGHWLLIRDTHRFRIRVCPQPNGLEYNEESIPVEAGHISAIPPLKHRGDVVLELERYASTDPRIRATLRYLDTVPTALPSVPPDPKNTHVLLTNGRGGMARLCLDLGRIHSKYDCLLGANLHPEVPVDRHVFAKRIRVWVNADGFISPLDASNLVNVETAAPTHWRFIANAGDGRSVEIRVVADMLEGKNITVFQFSRPAAASHDSRFGKPLPPSFDVRLVVRVDVEDRNFHWETRLNPDSESHFIRATRVVHQTPGEAKPAGAMEGFFFEPDPSRSMRVAVSRGHFHPAVEWCRDIPHPVEASRGMNGSGDAYSPGWFEIPLSSGDSSTITVSAETDEISDEEVSGFIQRRQVLSDSATACPWELLLRRAIGSFVVRRSDSVTVIAGYPWFLDWGRDSLIAARGLITAERFTEVRQLLVTFGRFEEGGTLPNSIHGENASNRETSDASLWYGIVAEELAEADPLGAESVFGLSTGDRQGRTVRDVLCSIASGYLAGTPQGIRVDPDSALVWSPSHFTWMDTNHPAGTPRQGYPVEIQVLWIRLLRLLDRLGCPPPRSSEAWGALAKRAEVSFHQFFWIEELGWFSDCLHAHQDHPAAKAVRDDALRSNALLAVALDLVDGPKARSTVLAAQRYLVVPGALRSLAPLPVHPPLPVWHHGRLLNHPDEPYWGSYEGDEDTRRKPAYHNGTAWVWTFPCFCEAVVKAYGKSPVSIEAARAYLTSVEAHLQQGCVGQLPEILDGDAPHLPRGCDAQAWSVTEVLRVWSWLNRLTPAIRD
jgi:starch synthase (maltosyl-transferring)